MFTWLNKSCLFFLNLAHLCLCGLLVHLVGTSAFVGDFEGWRTCCSPSQLQQSAPHASLQLGLPLRECFHHKLLASSGATQKLWHLLAFSWRLANKTWEETSPGVTKAAVQFFLCALEKTKNRKYHWISWDIM